MSLNPSGTGGRSWNFSRPNDDDYTLEVWGTVVSLQEVQAREFNPCGNQPGKPRTWPDGNPVMNIRMGLATADGSLLTVTFGKAGKKQQSGEKPSLHMQLFNLTNRNMMELMGKTLHLWTWPANPNTGQTWGTGNPRQFGVEEVEGTTYTLATPLPDEFKVPTILCDDGAHGGQPVAMQQAAPQMQGQFYASPTVQQQPMAQQQPMQQMQPQPQAQPQPVMQPQPQVAQQPTPATQAMPPQQQVANVATAQMPQGMDPAVAQAMQAVGAVNVQPVTDTTGGVYDQDIPF